MGIELVSPETVLRTSRMRPAESIEQFLSDPLERYLSGPNFLRFCAGPSLSGLVEWGQPQREEAATIVRALDADRCLGPHAFFHDARRLSHCPDSAAFDLSLGELKKQLARAPLPITRTAVVVSRGLGGGVVAGFYAMLSRRLPVKFFTATTAAFEWLGIARPEQLAAELEVLEEAAAATPQVVFRLRELLDSRPPQGIAQAARALGVSIRSLQRHLCHAATSFREELNAARVRDAQRLLESSNLKITSIALEVGCASSQHFSALFRKLTGESPRAWRAGHRHPQTAATAPAG